MSTRIQRCGIGGGPIVVTAIRVSIAASISAVLLQAACAGVPTITEYSALVGAAASRGELGYDVEVIGARVAVGAPAADAQSNAGTFGGGQPVQNSGAVSRWERSAAGSYAEITGPILPNPQSPDGRFGVSLDSFGARLAATQPSPPRVRVYQFDNAVTLEQTLIPQQLGAAGNLAIVSVSTFADYAAVGVVRNYSNSGSVEFFRRVGGQWASTHVIDSPTPAAPNIGFGYSTTMTEGSVFIGTPYFDPVGGETIPGAVFEYGRPGSGTVWPLRNILSLPPSAPTEQPALFGFSTDSAGTLMVAGAPQFRSTPTGPEVGAVVVHEYDPGSDIWVRRATLINPELEADSDFGYAVATNGDDIVIGAPNGNNQNGVAYWYTRTGLESWELVHRMARTAVGAHGFGSAIALTSDASAVIGAPGFSQVGGAAYEFKAEQLLADGFE